MKTEAPQFKIIEQVIPANGFFGDSYDGNKFYIIEAAGPLFVKTDTTVSLPYKQGQGQMFDKPFRRLEFKNPNAFPIYIRVYTGYGDYIDRRFQLIEANTSFKCNALTSIAATTAEVFNGTPSNNEILRKSILVSNNDSSNNLELRDESNVSGLIIFPKTSVMIPTSDYVEVYNPTGGGVACRVSELWYIT